MGETSASTAQAVPHRRAPVTVALATLIGLLATLLTAVPAWGAADAGEFDAGYIISDAQMYTDAAMTESEIQSFLKSKGQANGCTSSKCLYKLTVDTNDKPASTTCSAYDGEAGESVARIIWRMQRLCDISAKVLLVTLQKEQGLITSSGPTSTQLKIAMGYGCPDTAPCNSLYYGIDNQIYWAARAFGWYRVNPSDGHEVRTQNIRYNPNGSCGSKKVSIRSEATAALYNYTPYTPNAAALDNLYGTGDSCSSYGNRNFWRLYTDWFGSPIGRLPSSVEKERVAGPDRYATSAAISASTFPDSAPAPAPAPSPDPGSSPAEGAEPPEDAGGMSTVFVSSGENFPDGLSAAPAAALAGSPLLLTQKDKLPGVVRDEIIRLAPDRIVVVGGTPTISSRVVRALGEIAPVLRLAGEDRYETSREIARYAFPEGAPAVFFAIGDNFPDALAASAAAGHVGIPVVLVPRGAKRVDGPTRSLLADLGTEQAYVAGNGDAISSAYADSLKSSAGLTNVVRLGGDNRYQTAAKINSHFYPEAELSYLTSGVKFPDALSVAAVAGAQGAPLHLSPGSCLPSGTVSHLTLAGVSKLVFIGSSATLSSSAWNYKPC